MANIKSSIKRIKIANTRTMRNKSIKSGFRSAIKKLETAISEGDLDKARALYPEVSSKLDKAAAKGYSTRMPLLEEIQAGFKTKNGPSSRIIGYIMAKSFRDGSFCCIYYFLSKGPIC